MVTMTEDETSVLVKPWVTTEHAANMLGISPNAFRVYLCHHKEIERRFVGYVCVVNMDSVLEARRK